MSSWKNQEMPRPTGGLDAIIYSYLVEPVAAKLCGVPPNVVTIVGFLTSLVSCYHALRHDNQVALGTFLILFRYYCDCLDGSIARGCGTGSKLGSILDHTCDIAFTVSVWVVYWYKFSKLSETSMFQRVCGYVGTVVVLFCIYSLVSFEIEGKAMNDILNDNLVIPQLIIVALLYKVVAYRAQSDPKND